MRFVLNKYKIKSLVLLVAIVLFSRCAPIRLVKPLEKNEQLLGFSVGGPLINYSDHDVPMPLSTLFYARGITNNTSAFGGVHITSLFFGVYQTDIGICTTLYKNTKKHFGLTVSPVLNSSFDKWEHHLKAWPQLDINGYWEMKPDKIMLYAGVSNWLELTRYRANETPQPKHWFINPQLGLNYTVRRWSFMMEGKFLAPDRRSLPNVVEYKGINGHGAIGIYVAINRTLK